MIVPCLGFCSAPLLMWTISTGLAAIALLCTGRRLAGRDAMVGAAWAVVLQLNVRRLGRHRQPIHGTSQFVLVAEFIRHLRARHAFGAEELLAELALALAALTAFRVATE